MHRLLSEALLAANSLWAAAWTLSSVGGAPRAATGFNSPVLARLRAQRLRRALVIVKKQSNVGQARKTKDAAAFGKRRTSGPRGGQDSGQCAVLH